MREIRSVLFRVVGTGLSGLLLAVLLAGPAWALTATDCTTCHGADVVQAHHDTTDPNSDFNKGLCENCHVGVTTGNDCSVCHQTAGYANTHHIPSTGQNSIDCVSCHSDALDPSAPPADPKVCSNCHTGEPPRTYHHTKLTAPIYYIDDKLNCAGCHPDAALTSDCQLCHGDAANPEQSQQAHHAYAQDNGKPCSSCHASIVIPQNCQSCHPAGSKRASHHALASQGGLDCNACHAPSAEGSLGSGCSQCHVPGNNRDFHHQTVMSGKNLSCASCHSGAAPISGCNTCHQGQTGTIHHASADYQSGNCGACHTASGLEQDGCRSCHHFMPTDPLYNGNVHHSSTYIWNNYQLGCYDCHSRVGGVFQPPPASDCIFCHEGIVKTTGIPQTHHATAAAGNGQCNLCHAGSASAGGLDCAGCHLGSGKPPAVVTHHATSAYSSGACSTCHSGITGDQECSACHAAPADSSVASRHHDQYAPDGGLTCSGCHTGAEQILQGCETSGCHVSNGESITGRHHLTPLAQQDQCAACHTGVDATPLDCAGCHLAPGQPSLVTQHHATQSYSDQDCARCHNIDPGNIVCSGCHNGQNAADHHDGFVQVGNQYVPRPCNDCHRIQLAGGSCEACHNAPIPEIHHGDPLTAVGGNCGACHQTLNDPGVCANCHASSPHHTTTWSTSGDCAHCHAIPAWAADRPAQAACSACHGTNKHGKGGPVQHYGACAACHSQEPFHPYNSSDNDRDSDWGDRDGRGANGPGYDKFNMFVSENSRRSGGRQAPDSQLKFSKTTITHDGRSYTVPYFSMTYGNLALNKTASASRAESGYAASKAVDGDAASRWWAKGSTATTVQWLKVDLGAIKKVGKVALRWHSYYAKKYEIQVSTNNSTWTTVFSNNFGAGGMETRTFTARDARYIRIYCQEASSTNGFAIYELEAYAP